MLGAVALLTLVAPASSVAAAPSGPTMVLTLRQFPSGTPIPWAPSGTYQLVPGSQVTEVAPPQVFGPGTPQPTYTFLFWNITSDIRTTASMSFTAPTDTSTFDVTAWYIPTGGPGGPPGLPAATTYAFSLNQDQVINGTPIASVTPSGAWAGPPATTVSTTSSTSPVAITARNIFNGYGLFVRWLQFGSGSISNQVLTVPASTSSYAIAFFGISVPDPCQAVRDDLENLSPGDFPNFAAYQKARSYLQSQVIACERKNGEI